MELVHAAIFFGIATGIVTAGLTAALWEMATNEAARFGLLLESDFLTPVRVAVVVFAGPMILLSHAVWWLVARPAAGVPLFLLGLLWSFVQGVFILTQVFNVS